jgi:4-amino-4-deoxy-L-arabinose transferase-like glycosyltransferase
MAALIPLFPDETYYWEWSRRLAAGYFDHPPLIAVLIRVGTTLLTPIGLGSSAFAVRLGPVLAGVGGAVAMVATARRLGGEASATRAALTVSVMPLAAAGLVLATPDAPLLAAIALAVYAVVRAVQSPIRSRASLGWWCLTGVALGLAFASKYTSILLPLGVLAAVVARGELRPRLLEPGPYLACVTATLVFLPVLLWNAHHQWVSFAFQLQHGLGAPQGSPITRELSLIGGQMGLVSPVLFVLLIVAAWRALRQRGDAARALLGVTAMVMLAFFVVSAVRKPVEANWPAPAFVVLIPLLASTTFAAREERWLRAGWWLAGVLSAVVYVQAVVPILPVPPRRDPIGRAYGWNQLARRFGLTQQAVSAVTGHRTWIAADRYQDASELAFYVDGHPTTFSLNLSSRPNEYDLWSRFANRATAGDNLLVLLDELPANADTHHTAVALTPHFDERREGELLELRRRDGVIAQKRVWIFLRWRGSWP